MQKKILRGAQETLKKFNTELEPSTEHAVALKERNFQVPPIIAEPKKIPIQIAEINGKAKEHHNEQYALLLQKLVPLRKEFPKSKDVEARK